MGLKQGQNYILELKNISKHFGSTIALNKVNFQLKEGEIHSLMGENGAGKSTFIKIITGVYQADEGNIFYNGKIVSFKDSIEANNAGIAAIYQHPTTFPTLTVTENIFMGHYIFTKFKTINFKKMNEIAKDLLKSLNCDIDVKREMSLLSSSEQQIVEIAKALSRNAKILILDEPTASLSKFECEKLYEILDELKKNGVSMILITHRFEDMYRLADRVTVFRDSSYIGTWKINDIKEKDLIKAMVGRELTNLYPKRVSKIGNEILRVESLSKEGLFKDVSFSLKEGEILALTGLVGSGRSEVCETIYGIYRRTKGKIFLYQKEINIRKPKDALELGIGLLPEDRLLEALYLDLPIYENVTSMSLDKFTKYFLIDSNKEKEVSKNLCENVYLKYKGVNASPNTLSGGNQQKVVIAKLLNCDLKVLILDEPTKGIDILAKYSIYEIINEFVKKGYAVLMVSSDMGEVLGMADRIIVMNSGRITKELNINEATQEKIMEASLN